MEIVLKKLERSIEKFPATPATYSNELKLGKLFMDIQEVSQYTFCGLYLLRCRRLVKLNMQGKVSTSLWRICYRFVMIRAKKG